MKLVNEGVIGIIYRHGFNDYEFMIGDFPKEIRERIETLVSSYDDGYNLSGARGDRTLTLEEANINYWEKEFIDQHLIDDLKEFWYDQDREEIPSDEQIKEDLKKNPMEFVYGLVQKVKELEAML